MSAFAWLRRPCRPSSPPDASCSAGRRPDARRRSSSSDSLDLPDARAAAGVRHGAPRLRRGLRPVLAAALLALPLLAALPTGAEAQTVECTTAETDGSYTVPFDWALKPSGLAAGTKFRLLFVTSTTRNAQAAAIATYNTFVQTRAKAGHSAISDSCGNRFKVVGSTSAVDARANTDTESTDTAAVIYWLNGAKVADDYTDLYDGSWDNYAGKTETGANNSRNLVWTGSNTNGTKHGTQFLGRSSNVRQGVLISGSNPINGGSVVGSNQRPFYALSPVFTVGQPSITLTLSIPDDLAVEDDANNVAQIRVALSRALVSGETVTVPLNFAGASRPTDFSLFLTSTFTGVSLSGSTVTFTGPSVAAATLEVQAAPDNTDDDETVTVSLGTVTSTGVTVASSSRSGDGEIRLLEELPYTPSPGPPLVIVDSIVPVGGSCTGRECEITEVPAGSDIIINARLVRPALEKGVGFIPVAATRQIAVNAYLQPGVHAHHWLTPLTFAVGEKSKTALLRISPSTLVESDVRRMLMFSGPVGSWGEGNPPPFGVVTNDPYWITIKDGPDGNAGNVVPTVTVRQWHPQALDGGVAEGKPVHFEVSAPSPAQGPFTVHLKVGQTGNCLAPGNAKRHEVYFAPRVGSTVLTVPTVNDGTAEPDCTVRASLARADGTVPADGTVTTVVPAGSRFGYTIDTNGLSVGGHTFPHRAAATATVRDDDSVARKVSFVTNPQQVQESTAGIVDLVVAVDPAPTGDFTLDFRLSGTATRGSDYTVPGGSAANGRITVPSGATRATIPVTILDDSVEDSGEWVVVHLEASGGYEPFTPVRSAIRILNHEPGQGAPDWTDYQTVVDHLIAARDNPANKAVKGNPAHIRKWNRVLASIGYTASPEEAMPASEIHENAAKWPDSPFWAASVYLSSLEQGQDQPQQQTPEIVVTGGSAVTEGGDAVFTLTATPAPAADLAVSVTVASDGDWGVAAGTQTVTIPASGSEKLTLTTGDDSTDEPDGSVSVTVAAGSGYTVGSSGSGTVAVRDDDDPATPAVDPALVAEVRAMAAQTQHGAAHVKRWRRVLVAFGVEEYPGLTPTTLAEAKANAQKYSSPLWPKIVEALEKLEAAAQQDQDQPQQQTPEIAVTANAAAVTEGGDAVFTLTASPAPAADLAVSVTVAATGDYGVTAGSRTVTIPTTGSVTLTLATAGDDADEPDGSVTVTVADGSGWTAGDPASGTVAIRDDDAALPVVTIAAKAASVTEGGDAVFTLTASPAPAADLPVSVSVGTDGDYGLTAGTRTVTIPTSGSATLTLATTDDGTDEPDGSVTATVQAGSGYTVGASASGTVAVRDDDLPPPVVTIAAKAESVTEGGDAVFTLTADRAPDADLTVTLAVSETGEGDHMAAADEGPATVTIPKDATEASFTVPTVNDAVDEPDGTVSVAVTACAGCTAGDPASASVEVKDDDVPSTVPALSVGDSTAKEGGRLPIMPFTVRLAPAAQGPVRVYVSTRPSTPVSAEPGQDYAPGSSDLTFRAGETEKTVWIRIYDDSHDEGSETFEVVLSNAKGAVIGDGVAVGTIVNDDPMPAAFLARFGRTVAEQALDGIAGRMSAPRTAGMQGAIAGQAVGFGPTDSGQPAAGATPGAAPANGEAALAMAEIARGFGDRSGHDPSGFGNGPGSMSPGSLSGAGGIGPGSWSGAGFGETPAHSRTMTARDALLGSSFSLTGEKDGSGGSMAFWGRAAQGSFDGREGTFSLDGTVTTGMLGADYARGRWLVGLALAQSDGEGDYRDTDVMSRAASQDCPAEAAELCRGAVREGDGKVEASLTAAVPYAAFQASERLKLWGAAGYGTGEVTLKTELGGRYKADTSWSMAAAGMRGDLLQAPQEGSGPALAVTSDALWARTSSEKTARLAASDSDVTRLRVGLEGSYHVALEDGGSLVPKLEVGARHDGGDAETGFGVELGGGIAWTDPGMGLSLDLSGRTLIAHGNDDLKDRGFSAALAYDPAPATKRGASLSLRQDFGGRATGGLDALFQPAALEDRTGSEATSRWALEAAYGLPAFGGRWTGSPHVGLGLATGARDYSVGWRLAPEAANAPDLSFGVKATRRESDYAEPEHTVGLEIRATW